MKVKLNRIYRNTRYLLMRLRLSLKIHSISTFMILIILKMKNDTSWLASLKGIVYCSYRIQNVDQYTF